MDDDQGTNAVSDVLIDGPDGLKLRAIEAWWNGRPEEVDNKFQAYEAVLGELEGLASDVLGLPTRPQDASGMSLFKTVYWIASKGGTEDFDVSNQSVWTAAIATMLNKSELLDLTCEPLSDVERVRHSLRSVRAEDVEHPFAGTAYPPEDDAPALELRMNSPDLVLVNGQIVASNLQFSPLKVAEVFAFKAIEPGASRPSSAPTSVAPNPPATNDKPVAVAGVPSAVEMPVIARLGKRVGRGAGDVFNPIVRAMLAHLAKGETTPEVLAEDTKAMLRKTYNGGDEVCHKARATVWVVRAMKADLATAALTIDALSKMAGSELENRYREFLSNDGFGKAWDIFGKARLIVLEDERQAKSQNLDK